MEYALICSPGGSGLKGAVEQRLAPFVRSSGKPFNHVDVEDQLCASYEIRKALQSLPVPTRPNIGDVTRYLARTQVIRYWKQSLRQSLTALIQLDDSGPGGLNVLTCHLDLYGGRRREFYSPIDVRAFVEDGHTVSHVLLLIDDIYDMYVRLSQPGLLYDERAGLPEYMRARQRVGSNYLTEISADESKRLRGEWTLEYKANVLSALLAWRRAEMLMAEAVAHQLDARYMVYAIKQSTAAVASWLLNASRGGVYISHPITRPRDSRRGSGKWPSDGVVEECNALQGALDKSGVTCVMPTGIDELRFVLVGERKVPRLDVRWPIASQEDDFSDTLYVAGASDQPELAHILLAPDLQDDDRDWRPWLRSLENQISTEVPFRDHHLVAADPGLLVLRPYYGEGVASNGVAAEVDHWQTLAEDPTQVKRRAVFVHFTADIELMLRKNVALKAANLEYQITAATAEVLERRGFSRRGMARALIRAMASNASLQSLLDAGLIPADLESKLRSDWGSIMEEAQAAVMRGLLTLIELPPNRASIWIVDSDAELQRSYGAIAEFLCGEAEPSTAWIEIALPILGRVQGRDQGPDSSAG
jgi:hypothetical protein